ncbi:unnamed protein product [Camellia sinensis]
MRISNPVLRLKASMEPPGLTEGLTNSKQESIIGTQNGSDLFNEMKHQFLSFKRQKFLENLECYENLAKSQAPKFMVIACADSRVCLSYILGFQPREAFVVRNVANLVPPFENGPTETNAALEFAVNSLELSVLQSMLGHHTLNDFVLDIFVEIGMGQMDHCENDFEADMLKDTADYYSRKASNWILEDSCPDYMLKVEDELKLLKKVQHELLSVYATQLLEQEHSGCHALLRDDKVEDLSRMYRLFSKIPRGLNPVSSIFKQHVTVEGTALVKQAEDAASNKKADKKDVVGLQEQLHDKYMAYALKEAFEVFCNKGVGGSSSVELRATFCDNILKKGGSEKLSDETIEETLEKVVKLLAYISDKDLFTEFYRKKLARRLLFDKSANDEQERSILTKLMQQCGGQFTSKMEGMVTDLTLARKNQTNFKEYLKTNPDASPGIDLTVTVPTTGFWPGYKSFDLNLPAEM